MSKDKVYLLLLLLVALAIRLSIVLFSPLPELKDASQYSWIGWNLIHGRGFSMDNEPPYTPTARRGPTYPVFLAAIYFFVGRNYMVVRVIQAFMGVAIVFIGYLIAKNIFGKKIAIISVAFMSLFPMLMYYEGHVLTETLYTFLLALLVLALIKAITYKSIKLHIIVGVFSGLATLCRPELLLFPIALLLALILTYEKRKQALVHFGIFFIVFLFMITPWTIRNYLAFDTFIPIASGGDKALLLGNYEGTRSEAQEYLRNVDGDEKLFNKVFDNIISHPFSYLKLCMRKFVKLWKPRSWSDLFGIKGSFSEYIQAHNYLMLLPKTVLLLIDGLAILLGLVGVVSVYRDWKRFVPLLTIICYFTMIYTLIHAISRYRIPIMPYVLIFAVLGIFYLWKIFNKVVRNAYRQEDYDAASEYCYPRIQ